MDMTMDELNEIADKIRKTVFQALYQAGGGHFGGCLSIIEILTALYFKILKVDPKNPHWEERDRVILSKGHAGPALYVTLAKKGFFPEGWLIELDRSGGRLPKHTDRFLVPGIDVSSGALGQGLSIGAGMALSAKSDSKSINVYVIMGDGECNSGQIYEAAMAASKYQLDNLIGIVDRNHLQVDGTSDEIMPLEPFDLKWKSFGWNVISVEGNNIPSILDGIKIAQGTRGRPSVLIAETVKGKGISFMENSYKWHAGSITKKQYEIGMRDLEEGYKK